MLLIVTNDYYLSIMKAKQTLFEVTINIMKEVLEEVKPDVALVHGYTSITFFTALSCFLYVNKGRRGI